MADSKDQGLAGLVFKALADPTRRQILKELRKGPLAAGDVAANFPISGPSISRHLSVLKGAGLVAEQRQANKIIYSLIDEQLASCVFPFVFSLCPGLVEQHLADQVAPPPQERAQQQPKKGTKGPGKAAAKQKHKSTGSRAATDGGAGNAADGS